MSKTFFHLQLLKELEAMAAQVERSHHGCWPPALAARRDELNAELERQEAASNGDSWQHAGNIAASICKDVARRNGLEHLLPPEWKNST